MHEKNYSELLNLITQNVGMKKEGTKEQLPSGQNLLAGIIDIPQSTIAVYMSFFRVGKRMRQSVGTLFLALNGEEFSRVV